MQAHSQRWFNPPFGLESIHLAIHFKCPTICKRSTNLNVIVNHSCPNAFGQLWFSSLAEPESLVTLCSKFLKSGLNVTSMTSFQSHSCSHQLNWYNARFANRDSCWYTLWNVPWRLFIHNQHHRNHDRADFSKMNGPLWLCKLMTYITSICINLKESFKVFIITQNCEGLPACFMLTSTSLLVSYTWNLRPWNLRPP